MNGPFRVEDPWCRHIPLLHRLLADPLSTEAFPRVSENLSLDEACSVWETLHYLLRFLLGWDDPGAGLAWWYAQGKPVADSPLLSAVARWWGGGDLLDFYAAWTWSRGLHTVFDHGQLSPAECTLGSLFPDEEWWLAFASRPKPNGPNPFYGGTNPLHLGHSDWFGLDEVEPDCARLHFDVSTRRAVLIVNHLGSWRKDLERTEKRLPAIGARSWYVEVFDRQTAYLGLFRRSRESGRWFQGKHSVHVLGYRPTASEVLK